MAEHLSASHTLLKVSTARLAVDGKDSVGDGTTLLTLLKYRYHRAPLNNDSLPCSMAHVVEVKS